MTYTMTHTKENPAANGAGSLSQENHTQSRPRSQAKIYLEITVLSPDTGEPVHVFRISGAPARSLKYLYERAQGLTRIESLAQYGVLSLTQHVHTLRYTYDLNIETERVPHEGRDGASNFGRYHLISQISIRDLNEGRAQ